MNYKIPHYSLRLVKEKTISYPAESTPDSKNAALIFRKLIGSRDTEHLAVLMVNGQNQIVGSSIIAIGAMHGMVCSPRDVFKAAITANASAILLAHNHPSGSARPSADDGEFTAKVEAAGKLLGIQLLDHIIVTNGEAFFSFCDRGLLNTPINPHAGARQ